MEQLTFDRLQDNLKRLKLFKAVEILDDVATLTQANGGSYLSFLDQLLEEEVAAKDKRRVDTAMKIAGLPMAKTIEEYDFTFHPHLDKKAVMELFDLTFLTSTKILSFWDRRESGRHILPKPLPLRPALTGSRYFLPQWICS